MIRIFGYDFYRCLRTFKRHSTVVQSEVRVLFPGFTPGIKYSFTNPIKMNLKTSFNFHRITWTKFIEIVYLACSMISAMVVRRSYDNRRQNINETENRLSVKTKETEPNKNWKRLTERLIDLKYVFCRATIRFFFIFLHFAQTFIFKKKKDFLSYILYKNIIGLCDF